MRCQYRTDKLKLDYKYGTIDNNGNGKIVQIVHFDTFCAECVVLCGLIHFVRNVSFCAV